MARRHFFIIGFYISLGMLVGGTAEADDGQVVITTWEESNCRVRSDITAYMNHSSISSIEGVPTTTPEERALRSKHCIETQRFLVLHGAGYPDFEITHADDTGVAEFRATSARNEFRRCRYNVKKGEKLSPELKNYMRDPSKWPGFEAMEEFNLELEQLVSIECENA